MNPDEEAMAKLLKLAAEARLLVRIVRENLGSEYYSEGVREIEEQCKRVEGAL